MSMQQQLHRLLPVPRTHHAMVLRHVQEYDTEDAAANPAERLAQQRRRLHKRLGLDGQMESLLDTKELFKDEDLVDKGIVRSAARQQDTKQAAELLGEMEGQHRDRWPSHLWRKCRVILVQTMQGHDAVVF